MEQFDYFLSPLSFYAYLSGLRLEQIAARTGARVVYRPVDIAALLPRIGGVPFAGRPPSRTAYRAQDLERRAGTWACRSICGRRSGR